MTTIIRDSLMVGGVYLIAFGFHIDHSWARVLGIFAIVAGLGILDYQLDQMRRKR